MCSCVLRLWSALVDCIAERPRVAYRAFISGGHRARCPSPELGRYVSRALPPLLREQQYSLSPQINKIFAAHWVSDRQVVLGSKCNKVLCSLFHLGTLVLSQQGSAFQIAGRTESKQEF